MPKFSSICLKLQGFQFATAQDFNIGCGAFRLYPDAGRVIILTGSPYIIEAKMINQCVQCWIVFSRVFLDDSSTFHGLFQ